MRNGQTKAEKKDNLQKHQHKLNSRKLANLTKRTSGMELKEQKNSKSSIIYTHSAKDKHRRRVSLLQDGI